MGSPGGWQNHGRKGCLRSAVQRSGACSAVVQQVWPAHTGPCQPPALGARPHSPLHTRAACLASSNATPEMPHQWLNERRVFLPGALVPAAFT